jgi:hypothetical protein
MTLLTGPLVGIYSWVTWKKTRTAVPRTGWLRWAALGLAAVWMVVLAGFIGILIWALGRRA